MTGLIHPAPGKPLSQIRQEWDDVAALRESQISSGEDLSYHYVICPMILKMCKKDDMLHVIDAGCGTGNLTREIARLSTSVVGIDLSESSIAIARSRHSDANISYIAQSFESSRDRFERGSFTLGIANMVLMNCANLREFIQTMAHLLQPGARFVISITHPRHWPNYWGYASESWFNYNDEIAIEAPFKISRTSTESVTTHFHRPLATYLSELRRAGFAVAEIQEPMPSAEIAVRYPVPWLYPRFIGIAAIRTNSLA